ncbi:FAD/NAD(P)-binding protein [Chryseobacterium aquaticum]|uniref:FAD/NAD(P)-binding protein n=1 Tax=Chryseobacterium aquaticum TaxID=452084 RepID=UPI003F6EAA7C
MNKNNIGSLAIIGGGPAALLLLKNIIDQKLPLKKIHIFEKNNRLGCGMPYGSEGSCKEHIANVSSNELPEFDISFEEYTKKHPLQDFPDFYKDGSFNTFQVLPRLVLGNYLEFSFKYYIKKAKELGIDIFYKLNCPVEDIKVDDAKKYNIITANEKTITDMIVLCTGHHWSKSFEDTLEGWYDSPYPPSKFSHATNFKVAIRGTSLTAVDAVKTLARVNGKFITNDKGNLTYKLNENSKNFAIDMFSTGGFLPALRFHSEDDAYSSNWSMSLDEIYEYKKNNSGFIHLDYVFEQNFKRPLQQRDPEFYNKIKNLSIEEFVSEMMSLRKELDSFTLFRSEYNEAEKSIARRSSISWKETLAAFSYSMNYPAKHFSAEDMLRLKKTLMPLITVIIASLPQSSYHELMALYDAGLINLTQVNKDSHVEPHIEKGGTYHYLSNEGNKIEQHYEMFIDAIGQRPLEQKDMPFSGLSESEQISSAYIRFKDNEEALKLIKDNDPKVYKGFNENYYLNVSGLEINDHFQSLDSYGAIVQNLYIMAVPFIGGLNPDYSGLDFCDTAGARIAKSINNNIINLRQTDQSMAG